MFYVEVTGNLSNVKFSGKPMVRHADGVWRLS